TSPPPELPDPATWVSKLMQGNASFGALQSSYISKQAQLWTAMLGGKQEAPAAVSAPGDRRFAAREWRDNPYYSYVKQSYLLASEFLIGLAEAAELDPKAKEKLQFAVKQWCDAMSPANFAALNPAVLKLALDSRGESLTKGLANLIADTRRGRISQTDEAAFEVGRNLALTPGDVVYENDLIQLIQYKASTPQVGVRPLVIV